MASKKLAKAEIEISAKGITDVNQLLKVTAQQAKATGQELENSAKMGIGSFSQIKEQAMGVQSVLKTFVMPAALAAGAARAVLSFVELQDQIVQTRLEIGKMAQEAATALKFEGMKESASELDRIGIENLEKFSKITEQIRAKGQSVGKEGASWWYDVLTGGAGSKVAIQEAEANIRYLEGLRDKATKASVDKKTKEDEAKKAKEENDKIAKLTQERDAAYLQSLDERARIDAEYAQKRDKLFESMKGETSPEANRLQEETFNALSAAHRRAIDEYEKKMAEAQERLHKEEIRRLDEKLKKEVDAAEKVLKMQQDIRKGFDFTGAEVSSGAAIAFIRETGGRSLS